ncbi:MAG: AmmeMemoRadiSam system protein B [Proteobacteria bacterium]|nr:AmmeMemoRadiSam system protein B [Pseudomonadota bacterium]
MAKDVAPIVTAPTTAKYREAAVAGSWYPDDPTALGTLIGGLLDQAKTKSDCSNLPKALVSPHAGYRFSGATAAKAMAAVRNCNIRRVWVLGPSHHRHIDGVALYPVDTFRTPLGELPLDAQTLHRLAEHPNISFLNGNDGGEHSLEMELPLLQGALGAFELVPLLVGTMDVARAKSIAKVIQPELGPGDLVVVSSDFTHHGPRFDYEPFKDRLAEQIEGLDHFAWSHLQKPDPKGLHQMLNETGATICGRNPLLLLTAILDEQDVGTELAYTTSGDLTQDWNNSVSYLAARFDGTAWAGRGPQPGSAQLVSPDTAQELLKLAGKSLNHWFEHGKMLEVDESKIPADAQLQLGAFVTLTRADGSLRGCIGEIQAFRPAYKAVIARAVDAAIRDNRFSPVTKAELSTLHLDITLLGPNWQVSGPNQIILGRHGIVLSHGHRGATFLPQVATDYGWDRATMLSHLSRKAGIAQNELETAKYEVYEGQVIK